MECTYKFSRVQIFKDKKLGHGSYGVVYKAKGDALSCAAKLLHSALFTSNIVSESPEKQATENRQPLRRFEAECHFLSQIKHPNIIQYLGVSNDPDTNVPVLLMELMTQSLTHFLETAKSPLLFHVQVNILHDTALALDFLHSNRIIHRDLSSNNVLLSAALQAKVTDFGMSKFADAASPHLASLTQCPGTPAYMSPEALAKPPVYTEKLDCFSFGVLTMQVITQKYPDPADPLKAQELFDSQLQKIQVQVRISETERRQSHIKLIFAEHPLRPVVLNCIKDRGVERPTADQLCENLEKLKMTPLFTSSVQQINVKELTGNQEGEDNQTQRQIIKSLEQQVQEKEQENHELKLQFQQKNLKLQSSEELVSELQKQLLQKDSEIEALKSQVAELKTNLTADLQQQQPRMLENLKDASNLKAELTVTCKQDPKSPVALTRGTCVVLESIAYFNSFNSQSLYAFKCDTEQWSLLLKCPYVDSTLANINNSLTTIGGMSTNKLGMSTNKLLTLHDGKWIEQYPPMPTERSQVAVMSTTTHVVVIGGEDTIIGKSSFKKNIESLCLSNNQWSALNSLPYGISLATATLCGDILYLIGGNTDSSKAKYSVICCCLQDLLRSTNRRLSLSKTRSVWQNIESLPVMYSASATIQNQLLAIGGEDKQGKKSTCIYQYNRYTNIWSTVSHTTTGRSDCLTTVLTANKLLVTGGLSNSGSPTNEIEIATVGNYS